MLQLRDNLKPFRIITNSIWLKKSKFVTANGNKPQNYMDSESQCVDILTWITESEDLMSRFLALSGIDPGHLREAASEPGFLAGVVGFLMEHEPTLLAYCESRKIAPEQVVSLWHALGGRSSFETSI